jgi:membrane protease subunit HflK
MGRKEKTILIAILANIILIILRFFLANISGSIGLRANAWHSFTDVFVSSVVFLGLILTRFSAKRLKKSIEKTEHILAIFVALFIFYMGIEILSEALSGETTELRFVPFVAAGAFIGIIINYFMARYKIYVGEQTGSQSLIADGCHSRMDMYCSIAVLIGLLGSLFGMPSLDKISAIIAMVLMIIAGYEILTTNLRLLRHPSSTDMPETDCGHHGHFIRPSRRMYIGIGAILLSVYLLSGLYIVQLNEVGIVRRFGSIVNDNAAPGIHYRLPAPFEQVTLVNKDNVQKIETGRQELLTGDTNLVNINMSIHYRISNAADYMLNVSDLETLLSAGATTSIREIVGVNKIDYLLTEGKAEVEQQAQDALQQTLDRNNAGVQIVGVQLVEVSPPEDVVPSFQDLASARQDKVIYVNEATQYKNMIIPQANADAYKMVSDAQAYKDQKIKTAEGDAALFAEKQAAYASYSGVTKFRLYMESMDQILPNVKKILLGGNVKIDNAELWIRNYNTGGKN